jgi:Glycosyltransferases, probably involved in cell wall biogenesis
LRLSIIIPTLNEERVLATTLESVFASVPECEVIVVDGGSTDGTKAVVVAHTRWPIRWMTVEKGRGAQMNAAAAVASGDVLLFLHADTRLPAGASELVARAMADSRVVGGNFRLEFAPREGLARFYSACYNLRSRAKIFYGDSAIFVRSDVFRQLGGYRHARIMEDLDFVRRLRKAGRLRTIWEAAVISSSRRFTSRRAGLKALALWCWLHLLYYCGVSQERLERRYPPVR